MNVEEGEDIELLTCAEESRRYVISFQHNVARRTERICKVKLIKEAREARVDISIGI